MTNSIRQRLLDTLPQLTEQLRGLGLPRHLVNQIAQLAEQVHQPCVVAVVGEVKAGKSTFINALLGADLAKMGTTETTATINYFSYGMADPAYPVLCHWRSGQVEPVTHAFLNGLQGNDLETLRRADGIDHLEYRLRNPYLERVTLVDTPGTGAVVEEHQNRTAEFMNLQTQLRERHSRETQRIGSDADAVIYLVGQVARVENRAFLEAFNQITLTQTRALNAVGVMAKIDLQPTLLERRLDLAEKIAGQLREHLNTVVPVSAGIQRALDKLTADNRAGLQRLITAMRSIPPATLDKLLDDEAFFLELEPADCPVTPEERTVLLDDMPWTVFTTIARTVASPAKSSTELIQELRTLAGFDPLRAVLERHFFQRSDLLRALRIISDARQILNKIKYGHLPGIRTNSRQEMAQYSRYTSFIDAAHGDAAIAQELKAFLHDAIVRHADPRTIEAQLTDAEQALDAIYFELVEDNADFAALNHLHTHPGHFTDAEQDELRLLFGQYGVDQRLPQLSHPLPYVEERQLFWQRRQWDRHPAVSQIAERAVQRYGLILSDLLR